MTQTKTGSKTKKIKREVPFLMFSAYNEQYYQMLEEDPRTQEVIHNGVYESIKHAVAENKKEAEVFKLQDYRSVITIPKKDWRESLTKTMDHYVRNENYDRAIECQQLLQII